MNSKRWAGILGLSMLVGAGLALAAVSVIPQMQRIWFNNGVVVLPKANGAGATGAALTANSLTSSYGAFIAWDFPAIGGGEVQCAESATAVRTGIGIGDACLASSDWGIDGGLGLPMNVVLGCRAVADGVVFRACSTLSDAGVTQINMPDAGYFATTFGHR